jgi:hypothetical protein
MGGVPHVWRLDLSTGKATQLSTAFSERTVFVSATSSGRTRSSDANAAREARARQPPGS